MTTAQLIGAAIALVTILIAVIIAFMKEPSKKVKGGTALVAVVALTVTLLFLTVWKEGIQATSPSKDGSMLDVPTSQVTSASSATVSTITTTAVPTTTAVTSAVDEPVPPPGVADGGLMYLSDIKPYADHYSAKVGSAEIDQQTYPRSIWGAVGACSGSSHQVEYNIPRGITTFTAWIGLNKKSYSTFEVYFQVYLDGVPQEPGYAKKMFDSAEKISVSVAGKSRIALTAVWIAGGDCNDTSTIGYATWGDAQFS